MRIATPLFTNGQPRVKLVRNLVPRFKVIKSLFIRLGMNAYCTTKDGLLLVRRVRRGDTGRGASLRARSSPKLLLDDFNRKPRGPRRIILVCTSSTNVTSTARTRPITTILLILVYSLINTISRRGSD